MLTARQLNWALAHDWAAWVEADGTLVLRDVSNQGVRLVEFRGTFGELRTWAGY